MKKIMSLLLALLMLIPLASAEEALPDAYNWYEIFVYSYQDSNGDGIGDFGGVRNRLDYIADMGYTGIWFMPIMPSPSYHKYDVTDYKAVDPQYGTMADFRALVEDCHDRGIRVIIDLPLNHTSVRHPWFLSAAESIQKRKYDSPYLDYYCFTETPVGNKYVKLSGTSWHYEEQFSGGGMPDLNLKLDHKELLFFLGIRLYSTRLLAKMRGQTERNIRKVRDTVQRRIHRKLHAALTVLQQNGDELIHLEQDFLHDYAPPKRRHSSDEEPV